MTMTTVKADCTCPRTHEDSGMVPVSFQVSTDAQGMIALRAIDTDGQAIAELLMCPDEAFGVALALGANGSLADGPGLEFGGRF